MTKRILSILISATMLLGVACSTISASASNLRGSTTVSADAIFDSSTLPRYATSSTTVIKGGKTYYSNGTELHNIIRSGMNNMSKSVHIRYFTKTPYYFASTLVKDLNDMARRAWSDELSVTSTDGDYAHWNLSGITYDYEVEEGSKGYYYDIDFNFSYYNTASQEKSVDDAVASLVKKVRSKNLSDYDTIMYIHDYICNRTSYCYDALEDPEDNLTAFTAYGSLVDDEVVCQGYANAFYRVCKELGYSVRIATSNSYRGCHAWNMIKLDNRYYFIDLTWDDQIADERDDKNLQKEFDGNEHFYFLVDYDTLLSKDGDKGEAMAHYLEDELIEDDYFIDNYYNKLSTKPYNNGVKKLSNCKISLPYANTAYTGSAITPTVAITDKDGKALKKNVDYKLSYAANTRCGRAVVKITGLGAYSGQTTRRTFNIVPKKMSASSIKDGGRAYNSLTLQWKQDTNASGYNIQQYKNGAWSSVALIKSNSTTSYKISSLSQSKKYQFRVRAYKSIGRARIYGTASSSLVTYTLPKSPAVSSLKSSTNSISLSWSKSSCSGYEIQYSKSSSMTNAKSIKTTSTSKKISSLSRYQKYYVRVRAYKKVTLNGKTRTYYSKWSPKKSITTK